MSSFAVYKRAQVAIWMIAVGLMELSPLVAQESKPVGGVKEDGEASAVEIDWDKARDLYRRFRQGESLSAEDKAYLDRAREERQKNGAMRPQRPDGQSGRGQAQREAPDSLTPITDMASGQTYEGQSGGLYGEGRNSPSDELQKKAEAIVAGIQPLDPEGQPTDGADGKIVFISISMSNATQEFSRFKSIADQSDEKADNVVIVDCAQGGQAMAQWVPENARPWEVAMNRLESAGVSPLQVQVAWVKLANKSPQGTLEEHGKILEQDTLKVLQNAKSKFPNLKIAYLGSRIWAGNARGNLNPEPYAYESGFVVRWLIDRQNASESQDADVSLEKIPLLLWGPYLWAEGEKGRKMDDLVWTKEDFAGDGVHPSNSGREKVARMLLDYVTTNPLAKPWFTGK